MTCYMTPRYDLLYQTDSESEDSSSSDETSTEIETSKDISGSEKSVKNKKKRQHKKTKKNFQKTTESDKNTQTEKDSTNQIEKDELLNREKFQPPQQQQKVRQNITSTYSGAVNRKAEKILILTDSMLKTLRMREFNRLLKGKGIAYLKPFPGAKAKQLNHHSIPILEEDTYDSTVIHVGINDFLKCSNGMPNITKVVEDIVDIGLNCRNYNIGNIFVSSIVYCEKVDNELIVSLNKKLHEECVKNGFVFIDNEEVSSYDLWSDGVHMVESGKSIVANNIIDSVKNFLGFRNHPIGN